MSALLRARRLERSLVEWGRALYQTVFDHGDHRDLLRADPPRLLTIASTNGDILRLPWELIADERGALTRHDVAIRRQLETVQQTLAYSVGSPLRLLLVVSRPDNAGFIDPRHSTRAMLDALTSLGNNVTVEFCRPPTLARLEEILAESNGAYDIVHFDGHGNYDRFLGLGVLLFEKAQQPGPARVAMDPVRADDLGNLLARYRIPLVILEACRSSEVDDVAFRSVAPRLLEAGVGSVIAMSYAVHVEAAEILIARFYRELARGRSIGQAILLHAMGGMGKTTLAREAGDWLTRTGLFPDGACFLSFEQPVTAERIAQVLGSYLQGHGFEALSQAEQLARALQLLR